MMINARRIEHTFVVNCIFLFQCTGIDKCPWYIALFTTVNFGALLALSIYKCTEKQIAPFTIILQS